MGNSDILKAFSDPNRHSHSNISIQLFDELLSFRERTRWSPDAGSFSDQKKLFVERGYVIFPLAINFWEALIYEQVTLFSESYKAHNKGVNESSQIFSSNNVLDRTKQIAREFLQMDFNFNSKNWQNLTTIYNIRKLITHYAFLDDEAVRREIKKLRHEGISPCNLDERPKFFSWTDEISYYKVIDWCIEVMWVNQQKWFDAYDTDMPLGWVEKPPFLR